MDQKCSCCGNTYDKLFEVRSSTGDTFFFDCIECAAQVLAPRCAHCGCTILGHGVEAGDANFCGAHCARSEGVVAGRDHVATDEMGIERDEFIGR